MAGLYLSGHEQPDLGAGCGASMAKGPPAYGTGVVRPLNANLYRDRRWGYPGGISLIFWIAGKALTVKETRSTSFALLKTGSQRSEGSPLCKGMALVRDKIQRVSLYWDRLACEVPP